MDETFDLEPALAHFREHGYARLGRVMNDDTLRRAPHARRRHHARPRHLPGSLLPEGHRDRPYPDLVFGRGYEGPSLNYRKIEKLEKDDLFLQWIENPLFERVSQALIGGPIVIYRSMLMNKASQGGTVLPWHQDGGLFWGLDRDPRCKSGPPSTTRRKRRDAWRSFPGVTRRGSPRRSAAWFRRARPTPRGGGTPDRVARGRG